MTKGTQQVPEEQAVVKQLFDRCCNGEGLCQQWKLANDALKAANGVSKLRGAGWLKEGLQGRRAHRWLVAVLVAAALGSTRPPPWPALLRPPRALPDLQTKPGAPAPIVTDLCELGSVCEEGRLVGFHAQGWYLTCPFPGDLFAGFPRLRGLWANWNYFSGDINEVGWAG